MPRPRRQPWPPGPPVAHALDGEGFQAFQGRYHRLGDDLPHTGDSSTEEMAGAGGPEVQEPPGVEEVCESEPEELDGLAYANGCAELFKAASQWQVLVAAYQVEVPNHKFTRLLLLLLLFLPLLLLCC